MIYLLCVLVLLTISAVEHGGLYQAFKDRNRFDAIVYGVRYTLFNAVCAVGAGVVLGTVLRYTL